MTYAPISSGEDVVEAPFRLESVTGVAAPEGQEGVWQRYVITQGTNRIEGMRAGTHGEVSSLLEQHVEQLNQRLDKSRQKAAKR